MLYGRDVIDVIYLWSQLSVSTNYDYNHFRDLNDLERC